MEQRLRPFHVSLPLQKTSLMRNPKLEAWKWRFHCLPNALVESQDRQRPFFHKQAAGTNGIIAACNEGLFRTPCASLAVTSSHEYDQAGKHTVPPNIPLTHTHRRPRKTWLCPESSLGELLKAQEITRGISTQNALSYKLLDGIWSNTIAPLWFLQI